MLSIKGIGIIDRLALAIKFAKKDTMISFLEKIEKYYLHSYVKIYCIW